MNQLCVRELIFPVLAGFLLAGAPAIFADTNAPAQSTADFDPFAALSNSPLGAAIGLSTASVPADATAISQDGTNALLQTNLLTPVDPYVQKLETARYLIKIRQTKDVEPMLVSLLDQKVPEDIQKPALLELAALAQTEDDLPRAQQIYAQYLEHWPNDTRVPEVLLQQGQLFRQMGLHDLALTKFYAVMTAALTLKNDRLDYYEHLVVEAQMEIAETHFSLGKFSDAAEYYTRLFQQNNPEIDKADVLYKLICCYNATTNYDEAAASAQDYLTRYPDGPEESEVRFYFATALKALGHDNESLQQVLLLLQEQQQRDIGHPELWAYWQQRAGNLIANQFYREGDYLRALDIYTSLAHLDASPQWQLPVWYQIGMTYEHLMQPLKAMETYSNIVNVTADLGTNATPSLSSISDMAQWRINFIQWQNNAETVNHQFAESNAVITATIKPSTSHE
ncbi:MAG TPA: tetratricopeptide repeat protein [Verrucomicrobiae bacterium]|nr:tetratricopeptide repeat protein [Verrucomicrobiae bacterium]